MEPVVLKPTPDAYEATLTLGNETAALAGGASLLRVVAGAREPFEPRAFVEFECEVA